MKNKIEFFEGNKPLHVILYEDAFRLKPSWLIDDPNFNKCLRMEGTEKPYAIVHTENELFYGIDKELYDKLDDSIEVTKQYEATNSMKINVLGTEYTVDFIIEKDETMKAMDSIGYTDFSVKKIKVFKDKPDETKCEDLKVIENTTLRHELIHAFLYECGIDSEMQFHNEACVDFFALQFPKLINIFKKAGCDE